MDFSPELFAELRKWVMEIGINKSIVVLIVVLTAWRLPVILNILKEVLNFPVSSLKCDTWPSSQ